MKKIWLLLIVLLLPISVFAKDTCDSSNIRIKSITLGDTRGNIEEVNDASINGQKINLDLKMNVVGDSAEYKIVLKNESNEDYYFDDKSINISNDYTTYEVIFEDGSNIIKGGEEKEILLTVAYVEKISASNLTNGIYNDTQTIILDLTNKNGKEEILENPLTGRFLGFIIFVCMVVGLYLLFKDRKNSSFLLLFIVLIIPFTVNALCKHSLEIETKFVIDGKEAVFLPGREVNVKMKELAGDDTSSVTDGYNVFDSSILSVLYSEIEPDSSNKEEKNVVSTSDSSYPIYMWFDNGTIYWWSEDTSPSLNLNSGFMFNYMKNLSNIDGVESFDTSNTVVAELLFHYDDLINLDAVSKWNTGNFINTHAMFRNNHHLTDVSGVKNWDVSNIVTIRQLFANCYNLEVIDLSNWKTKSLTNMNNVFGMWNDSGQPYIDGKLKRIILSEKFDTSKVTDMYALFANNQFIEDYSFLEYFDTSNVTNMNQLFQYNTSFTDPHYIYNWDTSSLVTARQLFIFCTNLTELDLSKWDTSNVTVMSYMFYNLSSLETLDISSFDTSKVENFSRMFEESNNLRTIYVGEKWDISSNTNDPTKVFPNSCSLPNYDLNNANRQNLSYAHTDEGGYLTLKTN